MPLLKDFLVMIYQLDAINIDLDGCKENKQR
jgi:hypothetical protein